MSEFGLDDRASRLMRNVFEKHPNIAEVRVFGSRAKGNFRRESDVDFAIFGEVDSVLASLVASELDDLPLPYQLGADPNFRHRIRAHAAAFAS
jgi:predicted nucleotidyltransferase